MPWYYAVGGQQHGPVTDESLQSMLQSGAVRGTDLVWQSGMPQWVPAHTVPSLATAGVSGDYVVQPTLVQAVEPEAASAYLPQSYAPSMFAPQPAIATGEAPFFATSAAKLIVMSIVTLGLYEAYWHYQQWKRVKERTHQDIWPVARAIFSVFFLKSLGDEIKEVAEEQKVYTGFSPATLAICYFLLFIPLRLPDPAWLVSLLSFLPLLPLQKQVALIHARTAPHADTNAGFSALNIVGIVFGGLLVLLAVIGSFLPNP